MPSNVTIIPTKSASNLGAIFNSTLMSDHISSVSKSCSLSIRDLRRKRITLNFFTARIIATSPIHSKRVYCNSLFLNLPQSQLGRLQLIPVLKSLHWLKIEQRIQYKVACITYKVLQSEQPSYLHSLLSVQSNRTIRSSDISTLRRPSVRSRLKVTARSFTHHAPMLLYFGIVYPNNCGNLRRLHHSSMLLSLLLHLPCPCISFTLSSKPFSLNNPFLLSLVCTNSCRFSGPLTYLTVFISVIFTPSFISPCSSSSVSVNKPPSVLAAWQALCRHSESLH